MPPERCDVALVGGGPVGLWLALMLVHHGLSVRVLEQRSAVSPWSRAIGVHPPALSCLADAGVLASLLRAGVRIDEAQAFAGAVRLGIADFRALPGSFPYVLCVPQSTTERVLEDALAERAPGALSRGTRVISVAEHPHGVRLEAEQGDARMRLEAAVVIGCDGKYSTVREALGARFQGGGHGDGFAMGDFPSSPELGTRAFVVLSAAGVVESFPLPGQRRRWVARTGTRRPDKISATDLVALVERRTGHRPDTTRAEVISSFEAEHFRTDRWCSARMALAGDAAHIVSPLGGQGMNLGLLDAERLLHGLLRHFQRGRALAAELRSYARERARATRWAEVRARAYLAVARDGALLFPLRAWCVRGLLSDGLRDRSAAVFAMARRA